MARGKRNTRGGRAQPPRQRHHGAHDPDFMAARREAERRQEILADRRRTEAKWRPKIPTVRKCNFENFKNRFHDVDEPDYAVEVLMSGPSLQGQIRREQAFRRKEDLARLRQSYMLGYDSVKTSARTPQPKRDAEDRVRREKRAEAGQTNETDIQRIRVQSQPVLGHLTSLLNDTEQRSTPRTFVRPFQSLVYFQPKMKEILATLEEKWGDIEELDDIESEKVNDTPEELEIVDEPSAKDKESNPEAKDEDDDVESIMSVDSNAEDLDGIMDSTEALRDMRCYVNFIDKEVMPLYNQYDGTEADRVRFDDLWSLFRVGDLIYMPAAGETTGRYHEVWRIYRTEIPEPEIAYPSSGWEFFADEMQQDKKAKFTIFAYYIDHDGNNYGAVRHKFELDSFPGERLIESLEVFPIRYRHDHNQLLESLKSQGRSFQKFLTDRHQAYNAWTLTRTPPYDTDKAEDEILRDEAGELMRHPEFVESDVIVDLAEAMQKNPDWRPNFHRLTANKGIRCDAEDDDMKIQQWFDGSRQSLAYAQTEIVQKTDGVEMWQRRENLNADTFLRQRTKGNRTYDIKPQLMDLRDEDLVLLPKRMFAYALRERRFLPVNINFLKPIRRQDGVFENLKILKDYKDIVRGLVASHFQKKDLERRYVDMSTEGPSQDLIQNKGRGLVVLLHGVPGVGKTATAEAVAMEYRKPLFVITCGDLGLTPSEVESSLSNVFRLAHLWDCVLLLDEADVFLSQRSKLDMKRNALVSVFLRVLEYYNGLLFLTTNRVGTIDEAFKSRIHMSLYYPPLDKTQTRDIFRLNIAKLREIETQRHEMTGEPPLAIRDAEILDFAGRHFEENARSTGCWNGRQIRNAFQIASSLAHHNYTLGTEAAHSRGQQGPAAPVLDRGLFEKVQMSTVSFDKHMMETKGYDADLPLRSTFHREGRFE
ncbi:Uu.00g008750.m01.CDS01 [Anthostomella pinea]|uniref:Uu.00g008750.m01.CDS01 n=1 Tax=Anthostomella pinea TaxID=933095 RepID=A0AAI8YQ03_9PEZI|nr:Uu.00g008750.m01.CDS01 [Anthostomella pinea]